MRKIIKWTFALCLLSLMPLNAMENINTTTERTINATEKTINSTEKITGETQSEIKVANVIIKKVYNQPKKLLTVDTLTNNQLTFDIVKDTQIFSRILYEPCAFINLKKDMVLIVEYELKEDLLIAKNIEILKGLNSLIEGLAIGIVKEINLKQGYILLSNATIDGKEFNELLVYIDQFTKIRTSKDSSLLNKNILKAGQELRIITSGLLTNSMPPETVGLEVILILLQ
ncbi:MAG: hypothetical protein ATN31_06090 [Candidatus Epulonipiscioides saccharophilum]|nr:MAG: hypothetical protein ATN31_06090 [Epulopiscium sp. AS2M-Bin001]